MYMPRELFEFGKFSKNCSFVRSLTFPYGIFGGAIRSWHLGNPPRDIDIAIECDKAQLDELVKDIEHEENRFGGKKFTVDGFKLDVWPLEDTWALKNEKVAPTFLNLARYASFNVDCIVVTDVFDICDFGFKKALRDGFIEVNYAPNPIAPANALRGLRFCKTLNLKPGKSLLEYAAEHLNESNIRILASKYEKTYGESPLEIFKDLMQKISVTELPSSLFVLVEKLRSWDFTNV